MSTTRTVLIARLQDAKRAFENYADDNARDIGSQRSQGSGPKFARYQELRQDVRAAEDEIQAFDEREDRAEQSAATHRELASRGVNLNSGEMFGSERRSDESQPGSSILALQGKIESRSGANVLTSSAGVTTTFVHPSFIDQVKVMSTWLRSSAGILLPDGHDSYTFPLLTADVSAGVYAENSQISGSAITGANTKVFPLKVASLSGVSREAEHDMAPDVAAAVERSLARAISKQVDKIAYEGYGTHDGSAGNPKGAQHVLTHGTDVTAIPTDFDWLLGAIDSVRTAGYIPGAVVMRPELYAVLSKIRSFSGTAATSTEYALSDKDVSGTPDVVNGPVNWFSGVPILLNNNLTVTTGAANVYVYDVAEVFSVQRQGLELLRSEHFYLDYDAIAYRAIARFVAGFPTAAAGTYLSVKHA